MAVTIGECNITVFFAYVRSLETATRQSSYSYYIPLTSHSLVAQPALEDVDPAFRKPPPPPIKKPKPIGYKRPEPEKKTHMRDYR